MQGRLQVSSRHPRDEAVVTVSGERGGGGEERKVTVLGVVDRNRAIHNDRVAVRLLRHSERPHSMQCTVCSMRGFMQNYRHYLSGQTVVYLLALLPRPPSLLCLPPSPSPAPSLSVSSSLPLPLLSLVGVEGGDDITLGEVVGVLERERMEYVASFEVILNSRDLETHIGPLR